jgi:hypothetical protein
MTDTVRALHAWADTNSNSFLAIGAENGVFTSESASAAINRSPRYYTANPVADFDTVSGSSQITVGDVGSETTSYDAIYIVTPVSVGGLILSGVYPITTRVDTDEYTIEARALATATHSSASFGLLAAILSMYSTLPSSPA